MQQYTRPRDMYLVHIVNFRQDKSVLIRYRRNQVYWHCKNGNGSHRLQAVVQRTELSMTACGGE
jgi:hypothetical protein